MLPKAFRQSMRDFWFRFLQTRLRAELGHDISLRANCSGRDAVPIGRSPQGRQTRPPLPRCTRRFSERNCRSDAIAANSAFEIARVGVF